MGVVCPPKVSDSGGDAEGVGSQESEGGGGATRFLLGAFPGPRGPGGGQPQPPNGRQREDRGKEETEVGRSVHLPTA